MSGLGKILKSFCAFLIFESISLSAAKLISQGVNQGPLPAEHCGQFLKRVLEPEVSLLRTLMPENAWTGSLEDRMKRLEAKWPANVRIKDTAFANDLTPNAPLRKLPVVFHTAYGLSNTAASELRQDIILATSLESVGFIDGGRLIGQVGNKIVRAFLENELVIREYDPFRSEVFLFRLSPQEQANLLIYLENARRNFLKVIGRHEHEGIASAKTNGKLNNNLPSLRKEKHNCCTYLSLAPIGENSESLRELAGASIEEENFTGAEFWIAHLQTQAPLHRVAFVLRPLGMGKLPAK